MWTASYNREKDWVRCCSQASGFEWVDEFEENCETANLEDESETQFEVQEIVNLLEDYDNDDDESENSNTIDPWMENALRMEADLFRMVKWIRTKQNEYAALNMGEDEAALIQSTITSFAATTASDLETLRKIIPESSSDVSNHRSGIVQVLLMMLQSLVTAPFWRLQKQRTRAAVHLWQNPQECKLFQPKPKENKNSSFIDLIDGDNDDSRDQRFFPTAVMVNDNCFEMRYQTEEKEIRRVPQRPSFLENIEREEEEQQNDSQTEDQDSSPLPSTVPITPPKPQIKPYEHASMEESNRQFEEDLQQEVTMLTVAAHNDLDSVQQMEQRMVEITTLISQFSSLVGEQQEEILQIHDSAKESKANLNKGQESLADATDRQKKSRHLFAWIIFGMSMTLLFFHVLRN